MRKAKDQPDGAFGHGLPGTGGDIAAPIDDVEGHRRATKADAIFRREDDTIPGQAASRRPDGGGLDPTDMDVEGHLYRGGPTTQGEFAKRAPGENPHGER